VRGAHAVLAVRRGPLIEVLVLGVVEAFALERIEALVPGVAADAALHRAGNGWVRDPLRPGRGARPYNADAQPERGQRATDGDKAGRRPRGATTPQTPACPCARPRTRGSSSRRRIRPVP